MATTIPGGLYLSSVGKTYHDANGNTIKHPVNPLPTEPEKQAEPALKAEPEEMEAHVSPTSKPKK